MRVLRLILVIVMGIAGLRAERYLTIEEARKLCFPNADSFKEQWLQFEPAHLKAIQKKAGVPVRASGAQVHYAYTNDRILGVLVIDHVIGKHEFIDYCVSISPRGEVLQVEILEYRESHGGEIRNAKWRKQFRGKKSSDSLRLNGNIYNISGATMSCRSITEGIRRVLATYDLLCRPELISAGLSNSGSGGS